MKVKKEDYYIGSAAYIESIQTQAKQIGRENDKG